MFEDGNLHDAEARNEEVAHHVRRMREHIARERQELQRLRESIAETREHIDMTHRFLRETGGGDPAG